MDKPHGRNFFKGYNMEKLTENVKEAAVIEDEDSASSQIKVSERSAFSRFSDMCPCPENPIPVQDAIDPIPTMEMELEGSEALDEETLKVKHRVDSEEGADYDERFYTDAMEETGSDYTGGSPSGFNEPIPNFYHTLSPSQQHDFQIWTAHLTRKLGDTFNFRVMVPDRRNNHWTFERGTSDASPPRTIAQVHERHHPAEPQQLSGATKRIIKASPTLSFNLGNKSKSETVTQDPIISTPLGKITHQVLIGKKKNKNSKRLIEITPEINIQYGIVTDTSIDISAFITYVMTRQDAGSCKALYDLNHPTLR